MAGRIPRGIQQFDDRLLELPLRDASSFRHVRDLRSRMALTLLWVVPNRRAISRCSPGAERISARVGIRQLRLAVPLARVHAAVESLISLVLAVRPDDDVVGVDASLSPAPPACVAGLLARAGEREPPDDQDDMVRVPLAAFPSDPRVVPLAESERPEDAVPRRRRVRLRCRSWCSLVGGSVEAVDAATAFGFGVVKARTDYQAEATG